MRRSSQFVWQWEYLILIVNLGFQTLQSEHFTPQNDFEGICRNKREKDEHISGWHLHEVALSPVVLNSPSPRQTTDKDLLFYLSLSISLTQSRFSSLSLCLCLVLRLSLSLLPYAEPSSQLFSHTVLNGRTLTPSLSEASVANRPGSRLLEATDVLSPRALLPVASNHELGHRVMVRARSSLVLLSILPGLLTSALRGLVSHFLWWLIESVL